jgi:hypothetical protein
MSERPEYPPVPPPPGEDWDPPTEPDWGGEPEPHGPILPLPELDSEDGPPPRRGGPTS